MKVVVSEVVYVNAQGSYSELVTLDRKILLRKTLMEVSKELLNYHNFIRIHKSYLANTDQIEAKTSSQLIMKNGQELPLGRVYASMLHTL